MKRLGEGVEEPESYVAPHGNKRGKPEKESALRWGRSLFSARSLCRRSGGEQRGRPPRPPDTGPQFLCVCVYLIFPPPLSTSS